MVRPEIRRHFDNLQEPWQHCEICGKYEAEQSDVGTIYGGRMHPESELVQYEGKYYCVPHFNYRFNMQFYDDYQIEIEDRDINE